MKSDCRTALPARVHITGASGSGTTTLAAAISAKHGHRHLDTDDFYWMPTNPPYMQERPRTVRLALLGNALAQSRAWVLSGSVGEWANALIPQFDLVVFMVLPHDVRMARLRAREAQRYGEDAVAPGGQRYDECCKFLEWAAQYDTGGLDMRSRAAHEQWLWALPCPVLRLEGPLSLDYMLAAVETTSV